MIDGLFRFISGLLLLICVFILMTNLFCKLVIILDLVSVIQLRKISLLMILTKASYMHWIKWLYLFFCTTSSLKILLCSQSCASCISRILTVYQWFLLIHRILNQKRRDHHISLLETQLFILLELLLHWRDLLNRFLLWHHRLLMLFWGLRFDFHCNLFLHLNKFFLIRGPPKCYLLFNINILLVMDKHILLMI